MSERATSFEIQVLQDKRWILAEVVRDKESAVQFAENLLHKSNHEAVRVVRDFRRNDGLHSETVIHEKTAGPHKVDLSLTLVSETPVCTQLADAYGLSSRLVIGRMLRRYLDDCLITPTELLHNARELKRLADKDRLLMSAIDRVASLQAAECGEDPGFRRDFLYKGWDQLIARARRAAPEKAPRNATLKDLAAAAGRTGEEFDFQCLVLMSAQLLDVRGWLAKLEMVLTWAGEADSAPRMALLDGLIADLLMAAQAIQDFLGFQANLGCALMQMCDLVEGAAEPAKFASDSFVAINRLFAEGRVPQTLEAVLNRLARELRSVNPLSRNQPDQEYELFVRLLNRLIDFRGVLGGSAVADALTQRHVRFHNIGGLSGIMTAINDIMAILVDGCRCTLYLIALTELPRGAERYETVPADFLAKVARSRHHIDAWVPVRLPPRERMATLTACHKAILAAKALPDKLKSELASQTDNVLARYLEDEQVIEKIDKLDDPLALRALRLVKFCNSGVLIAGRSLEMAQRRILDHLRQPQFEQKFLTSLPDPAQAERHLREFHHLLVSSGFSVKS